MADDERKHLEGLDEQTERERWDEFRADDGIKLTNDEKAQLNCDCVKYDGSHYDTCFVPAVESIVAARVQGLTAERDELREQVRGLQGAYTSERLSHIEAFDQRNEFRDIAISNHALYQSAEDDLRRLRESVTALANEFGYLPNAGTNGREVTDQLRALLADNPQPTKGDERG